MNTPTPTPRTDAATYPADCLGTTLVTNRDCSRALETELVTFTGAYTCTNHNDAERTACPVCLVAALTAEAILGKIQELHGCSQEMVVHWCEWAAERSLELGHAQAEITTEREKVRVLRAALENLCDEQNGAPLCTREEEWKQAMDGADAALAVTEDAK
ncbi:MAG: hypothetical protein RIR25_1274 [Verrucomicrobiota bacterium]